MRITARVWRVPLFFASVAWINTFVLIMYLALPTIRCSTTFTTQPIQDVASTSLCRLHSRVHTSDTCRIQVVNELFPMQKAPSLCLHARIERVHKVIQL